VIEGVRLANPADAHCQFLLPPAATSIGTHRHMTGRSCAGLPALGPWPHGVAAARSAPEAIDGAEADQPLAQGHE
jgi:hypothetical protein